MAEPDAVADAIHALWQDSMFRQTEPGLVFGHLVTGDPYRLPDSDEVRDFIDGVVRGSLVQEQSPPPKVWWRGMLDRVTG